MKISYLSNIPYSCEGVNFKRGSINVTDDQLAKLMRNPFFNMRARKGDILIENFDEVKERLLPSNSNNENAEVSKLEAIRNATDEKHVRDLVKKETSKVLHRAADKKIEELMEVERQLKDKKSSLKKSKDEAEKDDLKKQAFEQK